MNPFEIKGYYICESIYLASCSNVKKSRIAFKDSSIPNILSNTDQNIIEYTKNGPMNLMDVQNYLLKETSKLVINLELVQRCDKSGLDMNKNTNLSFPTNCSATFQNFSEKYMKNLKTNIIAGTYYTSQFKSGMDIFNNFSYTSEYLASKTTPNDWKPLCQRHADIGEMLNDFSNILSTIGNSPEKAEFNDKYEELIGLYKQNNVLRNKLEEKLEAVTQGYKYKDSKDFLDSTVYVSVLWTILATTLLFYVFKKM